MPDSGGVVFVPAFVGLGTPYWGPDARGAIYGLTRGTMPAHIVRAATESMAFQAQDVLDIMERESGIRASELRVDGGAAANDFLMQLQCDLADTALSRPESVESTGLGAAYLAGIATGFWKDEAEVASLRREERRFRARRRSRLPPPRARALVGCRRRPSGDEPGALRRGPLVKPRQPLRRRRIQVPCRRQVRFPCRRLSREAPTAGGRTVP